MRRRIHVQSFQFNPYQLFGIDTNQMYMSTYNENKNLFVMILLFILVGSIIWFGLFISQAIDRAEASPTNECTKYQCWCSIAGLLFASILFLSIAAQFAVTLIK